MRAQKLTLSFSLRSKGLVEVIYKPLIHVISLKLQVKFSLGKFLLTLDFAKEPDDTNVYPKVFKLKHNNVLSSTHQV